MGNSELIIDLTLLAQTDLPIKLSLPQTMSFPTFTLQFLSPIPLVGRQQVAVWG